MPAKSTLQKIIRIRKAILKRNVSGKNVARCITYIQELELQISAYGNQWDENGWKRFAKRQFNQLLYLIPESKQGETIKKELYELRSI